MNAKKKEKIYSKRVPSLLEEFFDQIFDLSNPDDFKQYHEIRDALKDGYLQKPQPLRIFCGLETYKIINDIIDNDITDNSK